MSIDPTFQLDATTRFWHGGAPGIPVGKRVRPAAGLPMPSRYLLPGYCANPQRVHVTVDRKLATAFAAEWRPTDRLHDAGHGSLYRVIPIGDLENDPDFSYQIGVSYTCKMAVVEAVVETEVVETLDLALHRVSFSYWEPGAPLYDPEGYVLPNPLLREHGITAMDLRPLGRLPEFQAIDQLVVQRLGYFPVPDMEG